LRLDAVTLCWASHLGAELGEAAQKALVVVGIQVSPFGHAFKAPAIDLMRDELKRKGVKGAMTRLSHGWKSVENTDVNVGLPYETKTYLSHEGGVPSATKELWNNFLLKRLLLENPPSASMSQPSDEIAIAVVGKDPM
jgi:hypothetical protein